MSDNAPGWQPDPTGRFEHRYWDGSQWTDNVSNAGVASTDAYTPESGGADTLATPEAGAPADAAPGWGDPTATQPAAPADPTAAWPAAPPPPTFTPPAPATGGPAGPASSGSKKGLLIGGAALVAVAAVVAALLLMGGDKDSDRDRIRTEMAAQINDGGDLSSKQADCIADAIIDEIGVDKLKDVDFSADEPPADIADELFTAAFASLDTCDVDPADFGGGSDTTDTTDTTDSTDGGSPFGSGTDLPADFEQQLADVYENSMGLPKEKAECLAGKIAEAIESGDLTEEQAMSDIFGYFSDCNIDMSELSGN